MDFHPLVPCLEAFGDDSDLARFFGNTYEDVPNYTSSGWYCIDPARDIVLQNDAWVSSVGITHGLAVIPCMSDNFTENCETDPEVLSKFEKESLVQTKYITKYFNP